MIGELAARAVLEPWEAHVIYVMLGVCFGIELGVLVVLVRELRRR